MRDARPKKDQPKPATRTPTIVRVLVAVLSPVFFLLLMELLLRLFGYGLPSTFFVPWTSKGKTVYLSNPRYGEHFVPEELSRSPEHSVLYPKDPCTLRIYVFGESAANGDPEAAYGFCRQLEILLNEHSDGRSFEVVNAAVTAMNSFVARHIAEDCATHQPDLFILYMGNNEVIGPYGPPTLPRAFYQSRGFINTRIALEKDTRLGQLLKNGVRRLRSGGHPSRHWLGMEAFLETRMSQEDVRLQYCYRHFRDNIRDIVAAAHRRGAPSLLCTVPTNLASCAPFGSQHRPGLTSAQKEEWDHWFQAGQTLQQRGDFQAALAEYEKAQILDGSYADLAFRMGQSWLALDKIQRARDLFTHARDLDTLRFRADSSINQVVRQEAKALADQGARLVDLEASLEQAGQGSPLGDRYLLDHVHLNARGNFRIAWTAMEAIREALPQAHLDPPARSEDEVFEACRLRMLYDVREQYRLASVMYRRKTRPPFVGQLDHDAEMGSLRQALFVLRSEVRKHPEAESSFVEALKRAPNDVFLIRRYGDFLLQKRRVTEAIDLYRRALEGRSFDPRIRIPLAEALATGGARDSALRLLTEQATPFPDTPIEALQRVGTVYLNQEDCAQALGVYQELERLHKGDVLTLVNLATATCGTGDLESSEALMDRALKLDPNSAAALINRGNYHVMRGQVQEACALYERAVRADPYDYIPRFNLGEQELKLGQVQDGLKHVTESLSLQPDFALGYETLATAYTRLGKAEAARQYAAMKELFSP